MRYSHDDASGRFAGEDVGGEGRTCSGGRATQIEAVSGLKRKAKNYTPFSEVMRRDLM